MSGTFIALIILTGIIGGYLIDYQKNKLKWQSRNTRQDEEVDDLRKLVQQMKKRIENLEAIAAGDPDEFSTGAGHGMEEIEVTDEFDSIKEENEKEVSEMAQKRRTK